MKLAPLATLALVTALALTGCSGGSDDADTDAGTPDASGSPSSSATEGQILSPEDLPEVPEFDNEARGVFSDVQVEDCSVGPGEVEANGTAENTGNFARDIVVVMNWAVTATGDVVARGVATLEDLEPGESADWEVSGEFDVDEPVGCVPTALAGQLAG